MTYGLPGMFLVASPEACARACLYAAATNVTYCISRSSGG